MDNIVYWIWLSILNLTPIEKIKLIEFFEKPSTIYKLSERQLEEFTNSKELKHKILDKNKRNETEEILNSVIKNNIKVVCYNTKAYSNKLKEIYDYPVLLYCKGNIELLNTQSISIVGCRNCTDYGEKLAQNFSYMLAKKNYTIVSGLAKGIDTASHKGALKAKGNTVAVLGSGVNYIYPNDNIKLYSDIIANNGLIISEYGVDSKPCPKFFPQRNRIISGLSEKLLVIEASKKSGSIITANLALEQGKEIYAVPGNITSYSSSGTNELIRDGANLVCSLEDILDL